MTGKCNKCGKETRINSDKLCADCRKEIAGMQEGAMAAQRYLIPVFSLAFSFMNLLSVDTGNYTAIDVLLTIVGGAVWVSLVYAFAVGLLEYYSTWKYRNFIILCALVVAVIVVKFYTPADKQVYKPTVDELEQRIEELEEELERAERSADDYEMEYYELEREHEDMLEELEDAWYMSEVEDIVDDYS